MNSISLQEDLPNNAFQPYVSLFLLASLLCLPLSSTLKSIFLSLALITVLYQLVHLKNLKKLFQASWCRAALVVFSFAIVACIWSPAPLADQKFSLEKYSKLLYLPLLAYGFQHPRVRQIGLHTFMIATLLTSLLSILKFHDYFTFIEYDADKVFRNHIITGLMVSFSAYLALLFLMQTKGIIKRSLYALAVFISSYHILFVNQGRMAYILFFVLLTIWIFQTIPFRVALVSFCFVPLFLYTCYQTSPVMQMRLTALHEQMQGYHTASKDNDFGYRVQFQTYAYHLFKQHPIIGNGTASFTHLYEQDKPVSSWPTKLLEPHSQYFFVACEYGIMGLLLFTYFFWRLFQAARQLTYTKPIAYALLLSFLVGCISDSLLFYSGSGYYFILLLALCFGELFHSSEKLKTSQPLSSIYSRRSSL